MNVYRVFLGLLVTVTFLGLAGSSPQSPQISSRTQGFSNQERSTTTKVKFLPESRVGKKWSVAFLDTTDDLLRDFRQKVVSRMETLNFIPAHRFQHFSWLDEPTFHVKGWTGSVVHTEETPEGILITLMIRPLVESDYGTLTSILDYSYERYLWHQNNELVFLEGITLPGKGKRAFIVN